MIVQLTIEELEGLIRNVVSVELQKQNNSMATGTEKESDELLTREAVSKMLNVSFPTLWSWDKNGILMAKRMGSRVFYEKADVLAQLRKN